MSVINNLNFIKEQISSLNYQQTEVIAVSKSFSLSQIMPLIEIGHLHFGENKVQEANQKWSNLLSANKIINLHLLGKLQSNKAKDAFKIFNYIHTLDNIKLAQIFSSLEKKNVKKINYFVQVNIGNEIQKNGIDYNLATEFIRYCKFDLNLNIIGLMCIPPLGYSPSFFFKKLKDLADLNNLKDLSMGMSNDYIEAVKNGSTFVRIGNAIFGDRPI
jgi:pyridoxal phosphate enzyme (YggS family)